jgi:hypothetical protein
MLRQLDYSFFLPIFGLENVGFGSTLISFSHQKQL